MVTRLHLPFPPSVNSLFPGKVRRFKSKQYTAWIARAKEMLDGQDFTCFEHPVRVAYLFGRPDNRKRDLDNLLKAPNDFLVSHGVIGDDSLIHRISAEWANITGVDIVIEAY